MPSKDKRLTRTGIEAFEAKCDIGKELLQSILDMQAGKGQFVVPPASEARNKIGLSQSQFAKLLGVSVRTLQAGNKAANSRAAPRGPCLQSHAPIPKPYWQYPASGLVLESCRNRGKVSVLPFLSLNAIGVYP